MLLHTWVYGMYLTPKRKYFEKNKELCISIYHMYGESKILEKT